MLSQEIAEFRSLATEKAAKGSQIEIEKNATGKRWDWYDSSLSSYDHTFSSLSDSGGIRAIVTNTKFEKLLRYNFKSSFLGLELMGPGSNLFKDLRGNFTKTAGVTLVDFSEDSLPTHTIMESDILAPLLSEKLDTWREGQDIDVVIFRPSGGKRWLVNNPFILFEAFEAIYERMSDVSFLLAEWPIGFSAFITDWVRLANSQNLDVDYDDRYYGQILIKKNKYSPAKLPALSAKHIRKGMKASPQKYSIDNEYRRLLIAKR